MPRRLNWEGHREEIERLWVREKWGLKSIIDHMRSNRNFQASQPTYERRLREWQCRKNIRSISQGKDSKVSKWIQPASNYRVNKAVRRNITTTEAPYLQHDRARTTLELADGIMYWTPSQGPTTKSVYAVWINGSPWLKFRLFASSLSIQGSVAKTAMESGSSTLTNEIIITSPTSTSNTIGFLDIFFGPGFLFDPQEAEGTSSTAMRLHNLIPKECDGQHLETAMALCNRPRTRPSEEEIMIQLFLLCNDLTPSKESPIDYRSHDEGVVNLLQQLGQNGLQYTKDFLSIRNPTAEAIKGEIFNSILRSGDLTMLRFILTTGVDLKVVIKSSTGGIAETPLCLAAGLEDEKKSLDFVSILIDAGADVNYRGYTNDSVLVPALKKGHLAVANKLLMEGVQACIHSLELAIKIGDDKVVQKILGAGVGVNDFLRWEEMTPIGLVAQHGHISMAHMLIGMGVALNVDQKMTCVVSSGCAYDKHYGNVTPIPPLGVAISEGHLDMAEMLLEQLDGETNQLSTSQYAWSLLIACDRGHSDIALRLLNAGANVHVADSIGTTLKCKRTTLVSTTIIGARGKINMNLCKILISKGARLDYALLEAARLKNYELVTFLVKHNAPLKVSDAVAGPTALGCAVEQGAVKMAQHLYGLGVIDAGNPCCIGNADMVQFLHRTKLLSGILRANGSAIFCNAVRKGRKSLVKELMAHDDDIDFSKVTGWHGRFSDPLVPLDTAVCFGTPKLIDYLLKRRATFGRLTLRRAVEHENRRKILDVLLLSNPKTWDPDDIEPEDGPVGRFHEDVEDSPALISAIEKGYSSIFHTLLSAVNWGSKRLGQALTAAILYNQDYLAEDLQLAGASLEEEWRRGDAEPLVVSALAAAVERKRVSLALQLIEAGADVNKPAGDFWSRTALQQAAEIGNLILVNILLAKGAEVNAPPGPCMGATALQCAAIGGHLEIARRLLHAGANVNAERSDEYGRTALEGAAEHGHIEMVNLLLESGARVKGIYADQYLNAVRLAKRNGHNPVARFLESVHSTRIEQSDLDDDDDYLPSADESESEQTDEEQDVRDTTFLPTGASTDEFMTSSEWQADGVSSEFLPSWEIDITGEVTNGENNGDLLRPEDNFRNQIQALENPSNWNEGQMVLSNSGFAGSDGSPMMGSELWLEFLEDTDNIG